ncbi:MAG TPA: protein kinase [Burkholderiaceae bacterium]|jgi:serine/threonine protein phosphatase PrpC
MATALTVTLGQHSRAGRKAVNQDFHGVMLPRQPLLSSKGIVVALADGIGSSAVSQEASAAAVRGFLDDYYATSDAWSVRNSAQRVLGATNAWLHAQTMRGAARFDKDRGYVCTFSALILKGREVHLVHIGDTRIYRLHARSWEQLTDDHRVHLSSAESFLGRALGAGPNVEIDYRCLPAETGEIYVLASDGAYMHITAADVSQAVARFPDNLDAAACALVAVAEERGADDDMTVQLLRIDSLPDLDARQLLAQCDQLAVPPPLAPRMKFEGYSIVRELHVSSRSHVLLATDDQTGASVVIKAPSIDQEHGASHLDGFLLEEWVARRLDSPHVLKAFGAGQRPRSHVFAAMEFIEGQSLTQWMIDHPRPDLETVRAIVTQLGKGIQALHGKEMIHQDIQPGNAMIDRAGTVRIIDFSSTHVPGLTESDFPTRTPLSVGTLQYTAPECFIGELGSVRTDLFSLAALTYQLLTGQLPYGLQVTRVRSTADLKPLRYVPVRHARADLPEWIDGVLKKALSPNPQRRQEAVSEFLHELHSPPQGWRLARKVPLAERNPVVFWQAMSLILALIALTLFGLRMHGI